MTTRRALHTALLVAFASMLTGCLKLIAGTTGKVFHHASPAFDQSWDYEFAGTAAPGAILQIDGLLQLVPDDEVLLLEAAKGYAGYAFGYIEDAAEAAEARGDLEENDRQRARARAMYLQARDRAKRAVRNRDDGVDEAIRRGPDALATYLAHEFRSKKDAPALFWTGFSWGLAIGVSLDDASLVADLALARAFVERSVALDDSYYFASGLAFLGYSDAIVGEAVGGHPQRGKEFFERALTKTHRKVFMTQLFYAKTYAVQTQDRALYERLLHEIIDGGDPDPNARLMNQIARRRAIRALANVNQLF